VSWQEELRDGNIGGNLFDSVAATIGGTLSIIVSSLVDDVSLPKAGRVLRRIGSSNVDVRMSNPNSVAVRTLASAGTVAAPQPTIGLFINAVVKFIVVAFVSFLVVRGINAIRNERTAA
jgi:large conductance mechanosensitive channel